MKKCECCCALNGAQAQTCANCGEASWVAHVAAPVAPAQVSKPHDSEHPKYSSKGKGR